MIFPDTKRGADKKKQILKKRNHNSELYNTSNDSISTCIPSKQNTKKKKKKERTKSNLYKPYLFFLFYSLLPCQILLIFIDLCPAAILFTNAIRPSTH